MKKLYNHTRIHPSPPQPSSSPTLNHRLPFLPLAITTLAAALSPEDQEVLAYLLSISASTGRKPTKKSATGDHPPQFNCNCFRCYTSFWVRWDASPNRKVIHEIIDVYEDGLICKKKSGKNKKERKSGKKSGLICPATVAPEHVEQKKIDDEDEMVMGSLQKGSVRKIVNFVGERIWGFWGV